MPTWVRQQLEDTAGLLSDTPERTKAVFKRLGVSSVFHPMRDEQGRWFYRVEGTTAVAQVISGQSSSFSTAGATDPRQADSRQIRFVVDLPANQLGPGWKKRAAGGE